MRPWKDFATEELIEAVRELVLRGEGFRGGPVRGVLIRPRDLRVLKMIEGGEETCPAIARRLKIRRRSATRSLARLVKAGFVTKTRGGNPINGRGICWWYEARK